MADLRLFNILSKWSFVLKVWRLLATSETSDTLPSAWKELISPLTSEFLGSGESKRLGRQHLASWSLAHECCPAMEFPRDISRIMYHVGWSCHSGLRMLWPSTQRTWHRHHFMQAFCFMPRSFQYFGNIKDKRHQTILCEWEENVAFVFWEHFPCMSKCCAWKAAWSQDVDAAWHEYPSGYYGIFRYSDILQVWWYTDILL